MKVKKTQRQRMGRGKLRDAAELLAGGDVDGFVRAINAAARHRQKWARQKARM